MPSDVGISCNEVADAMARDATIDDTLVPGVIDFDF
jgi:hypothetical protein